MKRLVRVLFAYLVIAIASRDYIAADRVAVEAMGIDPTLVGYLQYCAAVGLGNYDPAKIDVRGETIAAFKRTYKMDLLLWAARVVL
jgi:uncharacterized protein (DUF362 family)